MITQLKERERIMTFPRLAIAVVLIIGSLSVSECRSYNSYFPASQERVWEQQPGRYEINGETQFNAQPKALSEDEERLPEVVGGETYQNYKESNLYNEAAAEAELDFVIAQQNIPNKLVCQVMEQIVRIFRNRLPPGSGSQFAVLSIVPESVQEPSQIVPFLNPQHENINYRFTRPMTFPNQNCRTHAEIVAMRGRPNEQFNLPEFYQGFIRANPGNPPQFAVLYTWIHPCRDCTSAIAANFGQGHGSIPAFDVPTYVGRTTQGNLINPPLTDADRAAIANLLRLNLISLFYIRAPRGSIQLQDERDNRTMIAEYEDTLCDSCSLNENINNLFNCKDTGSSTPDSCSPQVISETEELDQNGNIVKVSTEIPCCDPAPVDLYKAAQGQKCKSDSPCGYHGYSYAWCYLEGGGWEYCCTGACGNHGNTGYDWCKSGDKWQKCHRDPVEKSVTANGFACKSNHQCGFHGYDYTWCYKDEGGWDYCCTSNCEQYGNNYDWCSAGEAWSHCKRDLPGGVKLSALQKTCREDSPCGYHGYDYSWCYLKGGSWDYCCTGDCGPHGSKYDWCTSGKKWSKCKMATLPSTKLTYNLKTCKSNHECGYHGYDYAWCYTTDGSWDYCCTEKCGLNGEQYDWCTTGASNNWKYCQQANLPETGITAKGIKCRSDHSCGYHGYDYSWCYTSSSWDYCCSSTCGKYNTESNFCAAGKQHTSCCCSEY